MTTEIPILRDSVKLAAATEADIFVDESGALPSAGENAYGPTYTKGAADEYVSVTTLGIATVTASAAIAKGAALMVTATGRVATKAGNTVTVARALGAAAADGDKLKAHLIPN